MTLMIYSADFETTPFNFDAEKSYLLERRFLCLVNYHNQDDKLYFNLETKEGKENFKKFIFSFTRKRNVRIYFHNLNFDIAFVFDDIADDFNIDIIRTNSTLLRIQLFKFYNKQYKGKIKRYKHVIIEFRNSLAVFRTSLADLGLSINYPKFNQDYQADITPEYIEYCYRDCLIPIKAFEKLVNRMNIQYDGLNLKMDKMPLTISALNKKTLNFVNYNKYGKKEFIYYAYNPSVKQLEPFFRPKYFGGRVEVYDFNIIKYGSYNDVNGLYQNPMVRESFPAGKISRFVCSNNECIRLWNTNPKVFACECVIQENYDLPLIPQRFKGKILFVKGIKKALLFRKEFEKLKEIGGKVLRIKAIYVCETYIKPFNEYLEPLIELKKKSRGFTRDLAKVQQNGVYGKMGEKDIKEKIRIIKEIHHLSEKELNKVEGIYHNGKMLYLYKETYKADYLFTNIIWACFITAMSRLIEYEHLETASHKKAYADTDSVVCQDGVNFDYDDYELGKMKKEFTFKEFQALGCKEYIYLTKTEVKYNVLTSYIQLPQVKYKMKGFGKRDKYDSISHFCSEYFSGKKQHRQIGFFEAFNRDIPLNKIMISYKFKKNIYDKRWINSDLTTRAFDITKDKFSDMIKNNAKMIQFIINKYKKLES